MALIQKNNNNNNNNMNKKLKHMSSKNKNLCNSRWVDHL